MLRSGSPDTAVLETRLTGRAAPHPPRLGPPSSHVWPAADRPAPDATSRRPALVTAAPTDGAAAGPASRTRLAAWLVVAALLVGGAGVGVAVAVRGDGAAQGATSSGDPGGADPDGDLGDTDAGSALPATPAAVRGLAVKRVAAGRYRVTWTNPEPEPGDLYYWHRDEPGATETGTDFTAEHSLVLKGVPRGVRPCVEVVVVRNEAPSEARSACATR
jgi:hypothetical protein